MVKEISFRTSDNVMLYGHQFLAHKPVCYFIFFLGFGGSATSKSVQKFFKYAQAHNITSIVFTPRGHKESEGNFSVDQYAQDIKEITKKYVTYARLEKVPLIVGAHSVGTVALQRTTLTADHVILFNPVYTTRFLTPLMKFTANYSRKLTIALWNLSKGKKPYTDHVDHCRITKDNFPLIRDDMKNINRNRLAIKNICDCTVVVTTGDTYQQYNDPQNQERARKMAAEIFEGVELKAISNLNHFLGDGKNSFMHTTKVDQIINIIVGAAKLVS